MRCGTACGCYSWPAIVVICLACQARELQATLHGNTASDTADTRYLEILR